MNITDYKQLEVEKNMLKYFYGISTSACIEGDISNFSDNLVNIFNQTLIHCQCYSPFPNNPSTFGVFGESPEATAYADNFLILHALYTNCVVNSLQAIKHLAYQKEEADICSKIHASIPLTKNRYPFMPKYEAQLCAGHFSKYYVKFPSKFYDIDSIQWDSNRKLLRSKVQSSSLYKKIFTSYNLSFPNGETISIDAANSDFISHMLLNKQVRGLIRLLDRYSSKESLSALECKKLNSKILDNHFNCPTTFLRNLAVEANLPIKTDPVDTILFSYQFESIFHIGLYTNLLRSTLRNSFYIHLDNLKSSFQSTYALLEQDKAYNSFASACIKTLDFPDSTIPMPLITYAIKQLDNFKAQQYLSSYPNRLFHSNAIVTKISGTDTSLLEPTYSEWLLRLGKYVTILGKIFLPLLNKSFLITLLNAYSNYSYCEIMDLLYKHIMDNLSSFEADYANLKSTNTVSELIKKEVFTKFKLPANYSKCLNQFASIYSSNVSVHLDINAPIATLYLKKLYTTDIHSSSGNLIINSLANEFCTAEYGSTSSNVVPLYRNLSAQIVDYLVK